MKSKLLNTFCHITQLMWQRGWNEFNGGNITVRMTDEQVGDFRGVMKEGAKVALDFDASVIAGEYFLCKGTGKFFRHIKDHPEDTLAMIQIDSEGEVGAAVSLFRKIIHTDLDSQKMLSHSLNFIKSIHAESV